MTDDLFYYLDSYAIPYNLDYKSLITELKDNAHLSKPCQPNFIASTCPKGHVFYRPIYCGKEWCAICGEIDSPAHVRRYTRAWERIINETKSLGLLVITIPSQAGDLYYDPKFLSALRRYITRKLQRSGIASRGLCRWHWEGDIGGKFFPHLNFLFEGEWIPQHVLVQLRAEYTAWLKKKWNIDGFDSAVLHYSYAKTAPEKIHMLKYTMRPTLHHYSVEREHTYRAVRGTIWFGKWPKMPVKAHQHTEGDVETDRLMINAQYLDLLELGLCPVCGAPVKHRFRRARDVCLDNCVEMINNQLWSVSLWSQSAK